MTHITCRLTAKNRDQLRNYTLGNRVWAAFTFLRRTGGGEHGCTARSTHRHDCLVSNDACIGNESVPIIILNDTINIFFLNCTQHFGNFEHSECCLIKLLPYILFEKNIFIFMHQVGPAGEYHWTICARRRCSLVSDYFDRFVIWFIDSNNQTNVLAVARGISSGGVAIRYVLPVLWAIVLFAYKCMSIPLQRVTSLRRRAQANALAARV